MASAEQLCCGVGWRNELQRAVEWMMIIKQFKAGAWWLGWSEPVLVVVVCVCVCVCVCLVMVRGGLNYRLPLKIHSSWW